MNANEFDCFRRLQFELSRRGWESEAISLEVCMQRASGRDERMRLAGKWLMVFRGEHAALCERALAPAVADCVAEIQATWPEFR